MRLLFLLLPLVYVGGNVYLYWRSLQALHGLPVWSRIIFSVVFWIIAFSLFISTGLRDASIPDVVSRFMYNAGSVWMVFLLYMVLSLLLFDIIRIFVPSLHGTFWYSLAIVAAVLVYGNISYHHPKVERMELAVDKGFAADRLRIVAVSDVHLGHGTGVKALHKYVDLINSQSPDIVVIAGDLIDNSITPLLKHPFDKELARLSAPVYVVPGNHEYISGIDRCEEYLSQTNVVMLRDSIVILPEGVQIIGRDDKSNPDRLSLEKLMACADPLMPSVVLDHQPYGLAHADSLGVDIQISGHTHAGQIWPLNLLIDRMYEQGYGYRKWSHSHIWVSSGLSLWGPPFRIGTLSDLAVIDMKTISFGVMDKR